MHKQFLFGKRVRNRDLKGVGSEEDVGCYIGMVQLKLL